jgi:hypothetical protein
MTAQSGSKEEKEMVSEALPCGRCPGSAGKRPSAIVVSNSWHAVASVVDVVV